MRKEKLEELKYYIEELKTIKLVNTSGTFLKSEAYDCILNNGIIIKREKLIKGNNDGSAVIIMPVTTNNEILTVVEPRVFTKETVGIGLPAGYIENGEYPQDSALRELREETGMTLKNSNITPFARALGYYKDWPEKGKNRKIEIYYYEIKTDEKPDLKNTAYTEHEKDGKFELRFIPLSAVEEELKKNAADYGDKKGITKEMLELFSIYKKMRDE